MPRPRAGPPRARARRFAPRPPPTAPRRPVQPRHKGPPAPRKPGPAPHLVPRFHALVVDSTAISRANSIATRAGSRQRPTSGSARTPADSREPQRRRTTPAQAWRRASSSPPRAPAIHNVGADRQRRVAQKRTSCCPRRSIWQRIRSRQVIRLENDAFGAVLRASMIADRMEHDPWSEG
jgi:hypothetical protein